MPNGILERWAHCVRPDPVPDGPMFCRVAGLGKGMRLDDDDATGSWWSWLSVMSFEVGGCTSSLPKPLDTAPIPQTDSLHLETGSHEFSSLSEVPIWKTVRFCFFHCCFFLLLAACIASVVAVRTVENRAGWVGETRFACCVLNSFFFCTFFVNVSTTTKKCGCHCKTCLRW